MSVKGEEGVVCTKALMMPGADRMQTVAGKSLWRRGANFIHQPRQATAVFQDAQVCVLRVQDLGFAADEFEESTRKFPKLGALLVGVLITGITICWGLYP